MSTLIGMKFGNVNFVKRNVLTRMTHLEVKTELPTLQNLSLDEPNDQQQQNNGEMQGAGMKMVKPKKVNKFISMRF